jgi:hypothetical protein
MRLIWNGPLWAGKNESATMSKAEIPVARQASDVPQEFRLEVQLRSDLNLSRCALEQQG